MPNTAPSEVPEGSVAIVKEETRISTSCRAHGTTKRLLFIVISNHSHINFTSAK